MLFNFNEITNKYNLNISGIIHIGAHYGEEYRTYLSNNIKNVCFIEAHPKNYTILRQNIPEEVKCINLGLGSETKYVEMYVEENNNGQSNSFLKPKLHEIQYPNILFKEKITLKVDTLDNVINDYTIEDINMINIDVQGYELEVFKGSHETLKRIDYILSEVNRGELYENCVQVDELDSYLKGYGFDRVETTWVGVTWGDALYIKK